jgi:hypothetical protein
MRAKRHQRFVIIMRIRKARFLRLNNREGTIIIWARPNK